jgi:Phosphotransferase enzyme family
MNEQRLEGGRQTRDAVRAGETVRRPLHRNSEFVGAVLRHLEAVGFTGAPRFLGVDDAGREVLSFIEGEVHVAAPGEQEPRLSDVQLASAARLIRRFHATAGSELAGGEEVVCHGDLGPHNTVFVGDEAVGLVDSDEGVAPGPRLVDLAHAIWCFVDVGESGGPVEEQGRRIRLMCDAYGWADPGCRHRRDCRSSAQGAGAPRERQPSPGGDHLRPAHAVDDRPPQSAESGLRGSSRCRLAALSDGPTERPGGSAVVPAAGGRAAD